MRDAGHDVFRYDEKARAGAADAAFRRPYAEGGPARRVRRLYGGTIGNRHRKFDVALRPPVAEIRKSAGNRRIFFDRQRNRAVGVGDLQILNAVRDAEDIGVDDRRGDAERRRLVFERAVDHRMNFNSGDFIGFIEDGFERQPERRLLRRRSGRRCRGVLRLRRVAARGHKKKRHGGGRTDRKAANFVPFRPIRSHQHSFHATSIFAFNPAQNRHFACTNSMTALASPSRFSSS